MSEQKEALNEEVFLIEEPKLKLEELDTDLYNNRNIYLLGSIEDDTAIDICKQLVLLNIQSNDPIKLYINSEGGDLEAAFSIVDTIKAIKSPVYTIGMGIIFSAATLIISSGQKGYRFTGPNTHFLVHSMKGHLTGTPDAIYEKVKDFNDIDKRVLNIFKQNIDKTKIKKYLSLHNDRKDHYFFGDYAIELGLVDEYVSKMHKIKH